MDAPLGESGVLRDRVDDSGPQLSRKVMPHARQDHELGCRDRLGRSAATRDVDQRIRIAVDHGRRDRDPIQRPCPIRRGNHRGELTGGAGGVDPAIEGASSTRALVLLVGVEFP